MICNVTIFQTNFAIMKTKAIILDFIVNQMDSAIPGLLFVMISMIVVMDLMKIYK